MPDLGRFSAWVEAGERKLPEYQVQHHTCRKASRCWIHSEAGQDFAVCYGDAEPSATYGIKGILLIDGKEMAQAECVNIPPLRRTDAGPSILLQRRIASVRERPTVRRCLRFSRISACGTALDDSTDPIDSPGKDTGSIVLYLWKATFKHVPEAPKYPMYLVSRRTSSRGSHTNPFHVASFGSPRERQPGKSHGITLMGAEPLATFVFVYRPLITLCAMGIVFPLSFSDASTASTKENYGHTIQSPPM
ncbi:hypothetical protein PUNSTDRAFT_52091, partial [Punctularia strigosozonata HHB-11173 SS5]|uniref:uncharacterized protein n=1 Tax=Punctularia strigosozonata (strain HHB-11173) TaxID=741275 RepID=UPI000441704E